MWIDPHQEGTYLGQCAQYCGTQHAKMLLRVSVESPEDFDAWVHSQKKPAIQDEKEAVIWSELNKLDELHRIVMILRYFHELSISEISEIMDVNEGTIHSRLHSARERLRSQLKNIHGE